MIMAHIVAIFYVHFGSNPLASARNSSGTFLWVRNRVQIFFGQRSNIYIISENHLYIYIEIWSLLDFQQIM